MRSESKSDTNPTEPITNITKTMLKIIVQIRVVLAGYSHQKTLFTSHINQKLITL